MRQLYACNGSRIWSAAHLQEQRPYCPTSIKRELPPLTANHSEPSVASQIASRLDVDHAVELPEVSQPRGKGRRFETFYKLDGERPKLQPSYIL